MFVDIALFSISFQSSSEFKDFQELCKYKL